VAAILGKLPSVDEYMQYAEVIEKISSDVYRYLSFDQMADFKKAAEVSRIAAVSV
jgi:aconitate hydratase 2/2-methylisocitrate dehydratase